MTHTSQAEAFLADWNVHCTFGAVPGTHGVDRQEATEPDGQQRRWFAELLQRHGMKVVRDEIGNQFGPVELDLAAYAEIHVEQGRSMDEDGVTRCSGWPRSSLPPASSSTTTKRAFCIPRSVRSPSTRTPRSSPARPASCSTCVHRAWRSSTARLRSCGRPSPRWRRPSLSRSTSSTSTPGTRTPTSRRAPRSVAKAFGLSHGEVLTVAGHDSTNMKDLVPTVMLFVPSFEGVSHNLNEFTKDDDLLAGLDHLTEVLRRIVTDPAVVAEAGNG